MNRGFPTRLVGPRPRSIFAGVLVAAVAFVAQPGSAQSEPPFSLLPPNDLSGALSFAVPARCEFTPELDRIFSSMVNINADTAEASPVGTILIPGIGTVPIRFQRNRQVGSGFDVREVTVEAQFYGKWNGLRAVGLYRQFDEESDVQTYAILFADRSTLIRAKLNQMGFSIPRPGTLRRIEGGTNDPIDVGIGVVNIDGHSALECTTTIDY
jgi:hypothetical protein